MTLHLGQSSVLPINPYQPHQSVTKKISHYIFRFQDKIGQGNFSKVYRGYHQLTNQLVAIKIVQLSSVKSAKLQELLFSQIEVIQSLNHPNILKCHQVLKSQNNCYIITQLCDGGDLQTLLKKQKCLNQFSAASFIGDIYKGLLYLGQRGIVHRDLKVANIFLHKGVCKIADFGFAKYTNNQNFYDLDIGSPLYMSPQGMIDHLYGMKTDIWSFGIIIYQLLHGKTPFSYCTSQTQLKRLVVTPLLMNNLRPDISFEVKQLILKCLIVNFNSRPDAVSLSNDPYLKSITTVKSQLKLNIQSSQIHNSQNKIQSHSTQNIILNPNLVQANHQQLILSPQNIKRNIPLQSNLNSPHRIIKSPNSKQPSQYGKDQTNINNQRGILPRQQKLIYSPSIQNCIEKNYVVNFAQRNVNQNSFENNHTGHLNQMNSNAFMNFTAKSSTNFFSPDRYSKDAPDYILTPEQLEKRIHSNSNKMINVSFDNKLVNQSFDTVSNSSWTHQNALKKNKFPKVLSYENFANNPNLVNKSLQTRKTVQAGTNISNVPNSLQNVKNLQSSKKSNQSCDYSINQSLKNVPNLSNNQLLHNNHNPSNKQSSINNISLPNNQILASNNQGLINNQVQTSKKNMQPLNFKQQSIGTSKKFGQIIKGQKRPQGSVKSIIKLDKIDINQKTDKNQNNASSDRNKTKSQIKYQSNQLLQIDTQQNNKKRAVRHSIGQIDLINQPQSTGLNYRDNTNHISTQRNQKTLVLLQTVKNPHLRTQSFDQNPSHIQNRSVNLNKLNSQIKVTSSQNHSVKQSQSSNQLGLKHQYQQLVPSFLQKKNKQQLQKNVISTVIEFKEAVGFLHYCRLYFRFLTAWKNLTIFTQIYTYDFFKSFLKNEQIYELYSRFLLSSLNELIQNIRLKQIIYDGQSYKKKKLKQDKLKQVTEQYFKKYTVYINKNMVQNKKIQLLSHEYVSIQNMKPYNQELWQKLDQQYFILIDIKNKNKVNAVINENFINNFRNLCYFALRINEANAILSHCIHIKNYRKLADAVIQNWLSQQNYTQQQYFKLKNQHYKRLNQSHTLIGSQTNDTDDNRHENL